MSSISAISLAQSGMPASIEPAKNTQAAASKSQQSAPDKEDAPPAQGVKVTISGAAIKAARAEKSEYSDIEDSGLPESIQNILKMIRELKKKIAEQMAKLQAVMTNRSLSPEQARSQARALQSELASLNAALTTASNSLNKAMKDAALSSDSVIKATSLAMK